MSEPPAGSDAPPIDLGERVVLAPDAVYQPVAEELVLLQLSRSVYHSLDAVGARMFELLLNSPTVASALQAVIAEFDVEPDVAEADLRRLVQELGEAGLVVRRCA